MLRAENIHKNYGSRQVLRGVGLDLRRGEAHVLLGRNGSGKTTLARILAGLEKPCRGEVLLPKGGRVMLVSQDFVVWPHLSVEKNIQLGGGSSGTGGTHQWMQRLGLADMRYTKAGQLSHGQKQRVALARALSANPEVLILDESFSSFDPQTRRETAKEIETLCGKDGPTRLWITQQVSDLQGRADRISILEEGVLVQTGTPTDIYEFPANHSVAELTGPVTVLPLHEWDRIRQLMEISAASYDFPATAQEIREVAFRPCYFRMSDENANGPFAVVRASFSEGGYLTEVTEPGGVSLLVLTDREWKAGQKVSVEWGGRICGW